MYQVLKDFKKYYEIEAPPQDVYNALTHEATIRLWSGEEAIMPAEPGAEFSLWEGSICGRNIEFVPGKKIIQEWYFGEQQEPSIVTIILHPSKKGTSAELRHVNIPDEDFDNICEGWDHNYFGSIIDFYQ